MEYKARSARLFAQKPIVVLVGHGLDRKAYLRLRIQSRVCGHRYESKMISKITSRTAREFLRLGLLKGWEVVGLLAIPR
jgi:hypothetical protein